MASEDQKCERQPGSGNAASKDPGGNSTHAKAEDRVLQFRNVLNADPENEEALLGLGHAFLEGNGIAQDLDEALACFQKAADQESAHGYWMLYRLYSYFLRSLSLGNDDPKVIERFRLALSICTHDLLRRAAELGDVAAQVSYASECRCFSDGSEAAAFYQKAAEQGNPEGQRGLAWRYYKGEGVEKDLVKAAYWFRSAAEQGDVLAQTRLAKMYRYGEGVEKDLRAAEAWDWRSQETTKKDRMQAWDRPDFLTLEDAKRSAFWSGSHFNFGGDVESTCEHNFARAAAAHYLEKHGFNLDSEGFGYKIMDVQ